MEKEELGCLGIWESDKDYVLCNWDEKLLPTLYKKDEVRIEYNQRKWKCTKMVIRIKSELSWFNGNKVFQSVGLMFGVRWLIGKVKIESFQQGDRALN